MYSYMATTFVQMIVACRNQIIKGKRLLDLGRNLFSAVACAEVSEGKDVNDEVRTDGVKLG